MEVAGIIKAAEEDGIELVPSLASYGGTGGPVTTAAYTHLRDESLADARRHASAGRCHPGAARRHAHRGLDDPRAT